MSKLSTSMQVFRNHISRHPDGTLNVDGVISKACYEEWLDTKFALATDAEAMKFHRTLTNHLSGVDGRSPFDEEEEAAILVLFRKRQPWPCFPEHFANVGRRYRSKGFHEKKRLEAAAAATSASSRQLTQEQLEHQQQQQQLRQRTRATLQPFMSFAPPIQDFMRDNVNAILSSLPSQQATYVTNLGNSVVSNFVSPKFSLEDWQTINQILRFVVFASTTRASLSAENLKQIALSLCERFSVDSTTVVLVIDQTAKSYAERGLAQNEYALEVLGPAIGNPKGTSVDVSELHRIVLAVSAAFHRPGQSFPIYSKRTRCRNGVIKLFDMNYYVDPESCLLVIYGKLCAKQPGLLESSGLLM